MQHTVTGGDTFSIYSIRDEYDTLIKIQTCRAENLQRVLRFYKSKYPCYTVTPIIHYYRLYQGQNIKDLLKQIDTKLRPAPIYNHNFTPRANTKRLQRYRNNEDIEINVNFVTKAIGDILHEYNEYEIYDEYHQQDETGDNLSYCNLYNAITDYINTYRNGKK